MLLSRVTDLEASMVRIDCQEDTFLHAALPPFTASRHHHRSPRGCPVGSPQLSRWPQATWMTQQHASVCRSTPGTGCAASSMAVASHRASSSARPPMTSNLCRSLMSLAPTLTVSITWVSCPLPFTGRPGAPKGFRSDQPGPANVSPPLRSATQMTIQGWPGVSESKNCSQLGHFPGTWSWLGRASWGSRTGHSFLWEGHMLFQ